MEEGFLGLPGCTEEGFRLLYGGAQFVVVSHRRPMIERSERIIEEPALVERSFSPRPLGCKLRELVLPQ